MYTIAAYGRMIADRVRMDAYVRALQQTVKPGSVVLDIGTGTGIFALKACQLGARRVYAIEPSDAIQVAREIASANGYAERIEFIQDISTRVTLPERADVIVSDLRGVLPWLQQHIPSIIDARQRLLVPRGTLIPKQDTLYAAIVQVPDLYSRYTAPWNDNGYGLDMQVARQIVTNTWSKRRVTPEQILLKPQSWAVLDYTTVVESHFTGEVTWTATRQGTAHGLIVWFDAMLTEGVHFTNAPGEPELIYGNAFFPWSEPVSISVGDTVSVALRAELVGGDYVWSWETRVLHQRCSGRVKATFKQSTFFGVPLSTARLHKRASHHVPSLNEEGQLERFILSLMNGENSLEEIARRAANRFPNRFAGWQDALSGISDVSEKYSQQSSGLKPYDPTH